VSVLDAVTVDLPPTPTYSRREAQWVPADEPGEGWLTIRLWKGRRAGSRVERDLYDVQPDGPRAWLLLNVEDPSQPDIYRVCVDPRERDPCTCKASMCGLSCKHYDSVKALISEGLL
jgi:hypothetical protein